MKSASTVLLPDSGRSKAPPSAMKESGLFGDNVPDVSLHNSSRMTESTTHRYDETFLEAEAQLRSPGWLR